MCLIVLGWHAHPDHPLIVAANRDEFHRRPAEPAAFWADRPQILAGRDLEARGTWMGVSRSGRFAAVTNFRGAREPRAAESRGALPVNFLDSQISPASYVKEILEKAASYSGFNLLVCDGKELWWMSNRDGTPRRLAPGLYALGNALLDSEDVQHHKADLEGLLHPAPAVESLFAQMAGARIVNPEYGTRCSTILLQSRSGLRYAERTFSSSAAELDTVQYAI